MIVIAVVVVVYLLTQDDTSTPDPVETILLPLVGLSQLIRLGRGDLIDEARSADSRDAEAGDR